jgi:CRP/FNR family cyclic AMP-dependent transcriptional regulator
MSCDPKMLEGVALFEHLTDEDRGSLAEVIDHRHLVAGATLFNAGESGDSLFVVQAGEVELFIKDTAGQKIVLTVAGRGEIFGELSLLDQGARTATAVALIDSELLELDRRKPPPPRWRCSPRWVT